MDANLPVMAASSLSPTSFPWLSLITLLPAAVAPLLMLLPGDGTDPKLPRSIALATLLADLGLMLYVFSQHYDGSIAGLQLVERFAWVPAIGAGAWGCVISGAGPSILALASRDSAAVVSRAMVRAWESEGVASRAEVLQLQQAGSRWQPLPDAN